MLSFEIVFCLDINSSGNKWEKRKSIISKGVSRWSFTSTCANKWEHLFLALPDDVVLVSYIFSGCIALFLKPVSPRPNFLGKSTMKLCWPCTNKKVHIMLGIFYTTAVIFSTIFWKLELNPCPWATNVLDKISLYNYLGYAFCFCHAMQPRGGMAGNERASERATKQWPREQREDRERQQMKWVGWTEGTQENERGEGTGKSVRGRRKKRAVWSAYYSTLGTTSVV